MPPSSHPIAINVDLGEGYGNYKCGPDEELIPLIDHANVACGFHAGDPLIMARTVALCKQHGVKVGAHPGLPDIQVCVCVWACFCLCLFLFVFGLVWFNVLCLLYLSGVRWGGGGGGGGGGVGAPCREKMTCTDMTSVSQGFGRREIKMSPEELHAIVLYQIGALQGFLAAANVPLHHVKPHGILYGMISRDAALCRAVYSAVPAGIPVFGLAGTAQEEVARELGLPFVAELYGDVKYRADGSLVIDRVKQAWRPEDAERHIREQVREGTVTATTGETVQLPLGGYQVSLCCHSDSPGCVGIVKQARGIINEWNKEKFPQGG
ncbi:lactam utilization protein lamb [Phyllosticta paracitricarpa]|uniref:Lactam utilization protein lamb n=1 Tax=Phyllosticta paracitricarpa TaxID=2016321 RepID=A0ABR1MXU5_9PEZI